EASRSSQAGAACTTATLYFGCSMPIAASTPVDRRPRPMQSTFASRAAGRSTVAERKLDPDEALGGSAPTAVPPDVKRRLTHATPVHDGRQPRPPAARALAGHRLRRLRRARLQVRPRQRLSRLG